MHNRACLILTELIPLSFTSWLVSDSYRAGGKGEEMTACDIFAEAQHSTHQSQMVFTEVAKLRPSTYIRASGTIADILFVLFVFN